MHKWTEFQQEAAAKGVFPSHLLMRVIWLLGSSLRYYRNWIHAYFGSTGTFTIVTEILKKWRRFRFIGHCDITVIHPGNKSVMSQSQGDLTMCDSLQPVIKYRVLRTPLRCWQRNTNHSLRNNHPLSDQYISSLIEGSVWTSQPCWAFEERCCENT